MEESRTGIGWDVSSVKKTALDQIGSLFKFYGALQNLKQFDAFSDFLCFPPFLCFLYVS
jgi:hypothetical protein